MLVPHIDQLVVISRLGLPAIYVYATGMCLHFCLACMMAGAHMSKNLSKIFPCCCCTGLLKYLWPLHTALDIFIALTSSILLSMAPSPGHGTFFFFEAPASFTAGAKQLRVRLPFGNQPDHPTGYDMPWPGGPSHGRRRHTRGLRWGWCSIMPSHDDVMDDSYVTDRDSRSTGRNLANFRLVRWFLVSCCCDQVILAGD